jgi:hypothetical protein
MRGWLAAAPWAPRDFGEHSPGFGSDHQWDTAKKDITIITTIMGSLLMVGSSGAFC